MALYFLVASTGTAERGAAEPYTAAGDFRWRSWTAETFTDAQETKRLVFLYVTDPRTEAARKLGTQIEAHPSLPRVLASQTIPILVDRRIRPDIAERYAEGRSFQAMLLLPTGEALMILEDALDKWEERITEAGRYWLDHREDIQSRIEDFWAEYEESQSQQRMRREPQASDLQAVDASVRELVETALANHANGIWRVDVSAYLAKRGKTEPWARDLRRRIRTARLDRLDAMREFPPEYIHRLKYDALSWEEEHISTAETAGEALQGYELSDVTDALTTAADVAAAAKFEIAVRGNVDVDYPGRWLNPGEGLDLSLPHTRTKPAVLDGYLTDALAWLDFLLADTAQTSVTRATAFADSIWANLWSTEAQALRDKPLRDTPVREIELFPRPQLGRMALLLMELAHRSGEDRWLSRADSCLSGFAPYLENAGAASAYYGLALLRRFTPTSRTD